MKRVSIFKDNVIKIILFKRRSMASIRTFLKRTITMTNPTDSSSDTSSSSKRTPDPKDDVLRHPLLQNSSTNHCGKIFSCFINDSTINHSPEEQLLDENICLLDKKLPRELLLRIFSFLDYQSLCRCAQVSKVKKKRQRFYFN